jgi:hypothetical protein
MLREMLLVALLLLILLLPYQVKRRCDLWGRPSAVYRSLLWRWEHGPGYVQFDCAGLRRLQRLILALLCEVWAVLRGDLLRRLIAGFRWWLGL